MRNRSSEKHGHPDKNNDTNDVYNKHKGNPLKGAGKPQKALMSKTQRKKLIAAARAEGAKEATSKINAFQKKQYEQQDLYNALLSQLRKDTTTTGEFEAQAAAATFQTKHMRSLFDASADA